MKLKYMIAAFALACFGTGCDDKLETFEVQGYTGAPAPIETSTITSEALPGQIKLKWTKPSEDAYAYLKIWYTDPLLDETVYKISSLETDSMLIDDTRARFGEYEFFFQTFNANNEGSEVTSFKAESGKAPIVITEKARTEVKLDASQLRTDAQEPTEGPISNLVNGNTNDYFHGRWSNPTTPLPHYVQVDFNEEHQVFAIEWWNRASGGSGDGFPTVVELQISNDGNEWETVETLTGFASTWGSHIVTDYVDAGKTFTHFRYNVTAVTQNKNFFHMAELKFYDVELEVYDPESVELD